ncbi:SusD/RagB family nutrient-binding outer membrane lipoprotein, partial [Parabacteroides distasonis]
NKYPEFKDEDYRSTYRSRYSTINRYTYSDSTGPTFVCTYAQTQLLLAEAAVRGWVDGSAQTYYENGVRAACGSSHSSPTARRCIISI